MILLVASGLMARTVQELERVDPGFEPRGVLTLELSLPFQPYRQFDQAASFYRQLLARIRALPGVEAAGAVDRLPLSPQTGISEGGLEVEGLTLESDEISSLVTYKQVIPGYFDALQIPLVKGRRFAPGEPAMADRPVLISEALARRFFPGQDPVGRRQRRFSTGKNGAWKSVVGVVGSVRDESLASAAAEIVYYPILDRPVVSGLIPRGMSVVVRTGESPSSLVTPIREIVSDLDPDLPIANVQLMEGSSPTPPPTAGSSPSC